jgi:conjugal transfer pilus assembly protein TraF
VKALFIYVLAMTCLQAQSFYQDYARGWHWYEPQPVEESIEDTEQSPEGVPSQKAAPQGLAPKTSTEIIATYRKELENRLAKAWISPTPQNIHSYQNMQKDMLERSQVFSQNWMRNVFMTPALDHSLISPVSQKARNLHLDQSQAKLQQTIQEMRHKYGLFFFFSGNCRYCHGFAPIVKAFSETYGWEVLAITVDGGPIEDFPHAVKDNGLIEAWGVKALPALFAINPATEEVLPLAYGMVSLDAIETRLMTLLETSTTETKGEPIR